MSMFRRFTPVIVGLAAGCAATLLAQRYHYEHTKGPAHSAAEAPEPAPATTYVPVYRAAQQPDTPNVNPVADAVADQPPVADGRMDATKIAAAEDFADWEDFGCRG